MPSTLTDARTAEPAVHPRVTTAPGATLAAGLLVGCAEALFFALILARLPLQVLTWQWFGPSAVSALDSVFIGAVVVAALAAGWGVAWLLRRSGLRGAWWRFIVAGPSLLVASTIGVLIAGTLEPIGLPLPDAQRLLVFRAAFVAASATAALLCTLTVALALLVESPFRKAALTAVVTGGVFLIVALAVDPIPGWHVGGGDKAMVRVAMLGNLLAGAAGGAIAFHLLHKAQRKIGAILVQP
jgi:hypothetical protein